MTEPLPTQKLWGFLDYKYGPHVIIDTEEGARSNTGAWPRRLVYADVQWQDADSVEEPKTLLAGANEAWKKHASENTTLPGDYRHFTDGFEAGVAQATRERAPVLDEESLLIGAREIYAREQRSVDPNWPDWEKTSEAVKMTVVDDLRASLVKMGLSVSLPSKS